LQTTAVIDHLFSVLSDLWLQ